MHLLLLLLACALAPQTASQPADYPIRPVPMTDVQIDDEFWRPRMDVNRTVTIPHIMRQNEETGRVANFLKASRKLDGPYKGQRYNDTDVYKIVEAAAYSLVLVPDPSLDRQLDDIIARDRRGAGAGRLHLSGAHHQPEEHAARSGPGTLVVTAHQPRVVQRGSPLRSGRRAL